MPVYKSVSNSVPGRWPATAAWFENARVRLSGWPSARTLNVWLAALLGLAIVRFWVTPLRSSFWVDEMGTAFVVQHGADDPTLRAAPQVAASIYYVLPAMAQKLFGFSEIAYRLPSLLALALALLFIAGIAARLIHADAGWFAVFACLSLRDFNFEAADARPYALATCVSAAALYFLIRWLDGARWRDAVLFAGFAGLVWRVHLILWPVYVLLALYAVSRVARRDTVVRWWHAAVVFSAIAVSLIPVLFSALAVYRGAPSHVVADLPTGAELIRAFRLKLIIPVCVVAALVARLLRRPKIETGAADTWILILGWWLVHPLCLYAFSRLTGNSVFVTRYLYVALPGAALMATLAAGAFMPPALWKRFTALAGLLLLVFMGRWNRLLLSHGGSDWHAAAQQVAREAAMENVPVLCPSPFIEAKPPEWRPDYPISSFLYSHLLIYRPPGKLYPFPFEASPEAARYAADLSRGTLAPAGRFFIYGGDRSVMYWRGWFRARPEFAAWSARRIGRYGDVEVDELRRQTEPLMGSQ